MHIPNYFHVYLYLYLTYLDIFSCIFIPIFMYISTYFYIFLLISSYLLLFSTCRALQLLLPASGTTCLSPSGFERVRAGSSVTNYIYYYLPSKPVILIRIIKYIPKDLVYSTNYAATWKSYCGAGRCREEDDLTV